MPRIPLAVRVPYMMDQAKDILDEVDGDAFIWVEVISCESCHWSGIGCD